MYIHCKKLNKSKFDLDTKVEIVKLYLKKKQTNSEFIPIEV